MIYEFNGYRPVIDPSSFVHKEAIIIGNVIIGKKVYIGPGASIRGDWGKITIKDGCNVQDNCTIHIFPGKDVILEENAHIGHGAIIHGANIGKNTLVGMNSVIMDDCNIGDECIIGALCFIKGEMNIPNRKIVVGNPAIIKGEVSDEMISWKTKGTELYQDLPNECYNLMKECKPLKEIEKNRKEKQKNIFKTWKKTK
ncbi:MAG: transferase hexapeptide repeat family protein [Flavobacteriales bacterium]|jgi:carbonic anhydrase/acetyltransferase-like protein (isoleucine patch superfamily)|nr:transferase hexapeptide repeat family protein [Flavobacteriales bacterium]